MTVAPPSHASKPLRVAVIGSGIAGMSVAWLLSHRHHVQVFEKNGRLGGHSHTVDVFSESADGQTQPVDTGFIVYNEPSYPNLTALFAHLGVPTEASNMSFAASIDGGRLEYGGSGLADLFAQKSNLVRPRFWRMLADLKRFYADAPTLLDHPFSERLSLGAYLDDGGYSEAFQRDHLLPMGAAIWSSSVDRMRDYPAAAMIRFFVSHGLLKFKGRPQWRTVTGGSRSYVDRLTAAFKDNVTLGNGAKRIRRQDGRVLVEDAHGAIHPFDHAVLACHADEALALLDDPGEDEAQLLGAFPYQENAVWLHRDASLMPMRRAVWSSWNYLTRTDEGGETRVCVTYWMNRLQNIPESNPLFVTLNPLTPPAPDTVLKQLSYTHPLFDGTALAAQRRLWTLQGRRNTWYCGSYFGHGFHEDALQAGLACAEDLGGLRRPWNVENPSGRIHRSPPQPAAA